jgi:hypothetical protein
MEKAMRDLRAEALRFHPTLTRYLIIGAFFAGELLFCSGLLIASAFFIADAVRNGRFGSQLIFSFVMGMAIVCLSSFLICYASNAASLEVLFDRENMEVRTGRQNFKINISEIGKISFVSTQRGWMYIFVTCTDSFVITNLMYFDYEFAKMKESLVGLLSDLGKRELAENVDIYANGTTLSKNLRTFFYSGIWYYILLFTFLIATFTAFLIVSGLHFPIPPATHFRSS